MSDNRTEHRRRNGSRLQGNALAAQVARELNGMMLAQAFTKARLAGFRLQINKLDGVPRQGQLPVEGDKVMVDVVSGFINRSWAASH